MSTGQVEFFGINVGKRGENRGILWRQTRRVVIYGENEQHATETETPTPTALFFA